MPAGSAFTTYLTDPNYWLGNCAVSPKGDVLWENDHAFKTAIATQPGWQSGNAPLPPFQPQGFTAEKLTIANAGSKMGLAFTLSMTKDCSLAFFGSRFRGTHTARSDIDLILFAPGATYQGHTFGKLSVYTVDPAQALHRASTGDLFFKSLLSAHDCLWDPQGLMPQLQARFQDIPQTQIATQATALVQMLISQAEMYALPQLLYPRLLWALRTIELAEGGDIFDNATPTTPLLAALNKARSSPPADPKETLSATRAYIDRRPYAGPHCAAPDLNDWQTHFEETDNAVGLKTLKAFAQLQRGSKTRGK